MRRIPNSAFGEPIYQVVTILASLILVTAGFATPWILGWASGDTKTLFSYWIGALLGTLWGVVMATGAITFMLLFHPEQLLGRKGRE